MTSGKSNGGNGKKKPPAQSVQSGRASREVAEQRRRTISYLYRQGAATKDVHRLVCEKYGKISYGHVRNVIVDLRAEWAEDLQDRHEDPAGEFASMALADRRRALIAGDNKLAYAILKDIYGLLGIDFSGGGSGDARQDLSDLASTEQLDEEEKRLLRLLDGRPKA